MTVNEILEATRVKGGERFVCKESLHITAEGEVVPEEDAAGRYVLVGAGGTIPLALADALGLVKKAAKETAKALKEAEKQAKSEEAQEREEAEEVQQHSTELPPHSLSETPGLQSVDDDPNAEKVGGFIEEPEEKAEHAEHAEHVEEPAPEEREEEKAVRRQSDKALRRFHNK